MNKINLNKEIQAFVNRTILLNATEVRIAKKLNNGLKNFEQMEGKVLVQMHELNFNEIKNTYDKIIEELEEIEKNQTIQIIRLKQQLKIMEKKVTCFENILITDNLISEADRQNAFKRSLRLHLLKIGTGIFIDHDTPPNIFRGFVTVKKPYFSMKPFEFNLSNAISEKECIENIWDLIKSNSYYIEEWEELFLSS